MFLSRISCLLLASHAATFPTVFAQGLRKSTTISESNTQISNYETMKSTAQKGLSLLSSFIGDKQGKHDRSLASDFHYKQMGIDIDGLAAEDHLGKSVALSKDGLRVAASASHANNGKGVTTVFDWDATLEQWVQIGQDIVGPSTTKLLGHSIDMNEDGTRLIVGAPETGNNKGRAYVYELDATSTWQMLGDALFEAGTQQAGFSVTMNASGDQVAFGAPNTDVGTGLGRVIAYKLINGQWAQMGQNLDCDDYYGSYFGNAISMDASGDRLVIGGREDSYYSFGTVRVYDYDNTTNQWVQVGDIDGEYYYDRFGSDVDISEDGNTIAVAASTSDEGAKFAGQFYVYEFDGSANWVRKGQPVVGTDLAGFLGDTIAISGDGTHVAVGVPGNDESGVNAGQVMIFTYSEVENDWVKQDGVTGECAGHKLGEHGEAVALDRTGSYLAVGTQRGGSDYYSGMARVYESVAGEGTSGSINLCN